MSSQYTKSTKSRRRREEEDYERKRLTKPLSSVWSIPHAGSGDNTGSLGGLGGLWPCKQRNEEEAKLAKTNKKKKEKRKRKRKERKEGKDVTLSFVSVLLGYLSHTHSFLLLLSREGWGVGSEFDLNYATRLDSWGTYGKLWESSDGKSHCSFSFRLKLKKVGFRFSDAAFGRQTFLVFVEAFLSLLLLSLSLSLSSLLLSRIASFSSLQRRFLWSEKRRERDLSILSRGKRPIVALSCLCHTLSLVLALNPFWSRENLIGRPAPNKNSTSKKGACRFHE